MLDFQGCQLILKLMYYLSWKKRKKNFREIQQFWRYCQFFNGNKSHIVFVSKVIPEQVYCQNPTFQIIGNSVLPVMMVSHFEKKSTRKQKWKTSSKHKIWTWIWRVIFSLIMGFSNVHETQILPWTLSWLIRIQREEDD